MKALPLLISLLLSTSVGADQRAEVANDIAVPANHGISSERTAATRAARAFLAETDRDRLGEIWPKVSILLRATSGKSDWELMFKHRHGDVGSVKTRRLSEIGFTNQIAANMHGRYCIILFKSEYERATVSEKLAVSLEDGSWKIAGYIFHIEHRT